MIIDTIENIEAYKDLHPKFEKAFLFLKKALNEDFALGRYEIEGNNIFAIVLDLVGKGKEAVREAHRKYIDIHCTISGVDIIGWKSLAEAKNAGEYNEQDDYILFDDSITNWIKLLKGQLAIFFPHDIHTTLATTEQVKKIVVKLKV